MISSAVAIACCVFGIAAFGFIAGMLVASAKTAGTATFPVTHVSFDQDMPDLERLVFLEKVADLVRRGDLRQANKLGDNTASGKKV